MSRTRYDPSPDRQRIQQLQVEFAKILATFQEHPPLVRGSLQTLRRRCGKAGCRCERGRRHETFVFVDRSAGARKVRKVASEEQRRLRKLTGRYRELRNLRARLSKLHVEVLECCDRLREYRIGLGRKLLDGRKRRNT